MLPITLLAAAFFLGELPALTAPEPLDRTEQQLRNGLENLRAAQRAVADTEATNLRKNINDFALAYNAFIQDYSNGVFDMKKAKTLSKAMRKFQALLPREQ